MRYRVVNLGTMLEDYQNEINSLKSRLNEGGVYPAWAGAGRAAAGTPAKASHAVSEAAGPHAGNAAPERGDGLSHASGTNAESPAAASSDTGGRMSAGDDQDAHGVPSERGVPGYYGPSDSVQGAARAIPESDRAWGVDRNQRGDGLPDVAWSHAASASAAGPDSGGRMSAGDHVDAHRVQAERGDRGYHRPQKNQRRGARIVPRRPFQWGWRRRRDVTLRKRRTGTSAPPGAAERLLEMFLNHSRSLSGAALASAWRVPVLGAAGRVHGPARCPGAGFGIEGGIP
jgi:hypothetical protein